MSEQPHVLVVCTDHWPSTLFGHRGHPTVLTPTLDQLSQAGTVFTNCYSECPVCMPARRTLMTGTSPRKHGDRRMAGHMSMPDMPTMAETFSNAGYQTMAVGKLHVYPQRDRIGFDDVILSEEGRAQHGVVDDYEYFLAQEGYPGQYMAHCMGNNQYHANAWHLPDKCHVTNWATQEMCRLIKRRDPTRPGLWYLSYVHPHPPLAPLKHYWDLYRNQDIPAPVNGVWSQGPIEDLPHQLRNNKAGGDQVYNNKREYELAHQAFYALCTHIDHQLRLVIGTLREEKLLQNTIIVFTADHGDMLGNHGLWAKRLFYEQSANVPMLVVAPGSDKVQRNVQDDRLVGLQDVLPTICDIAGVDTPESAEGLSMVGDNQRQSLYGEWGEGRPATRMIRRGQHKLIYYPTGNRVQLFDLENDPFECHDLSNEETFAELRASLVTDLIGELYGDDTNWVQDGVLVGLPDEAWQRGPRDAGLSGQRGVHFPPPLPVD